MDATSWAARYQRATLCGVLLLAGCGSDAPERWVAPEGPEADRARALHADAILVDGHNDISMFLLDWDFDLAMDGSGPDKVSPWPWFFLSWLPGRPGPERLLTDTDLARMEAGGLDAQFFSIWVSPAHYDPDEPGRATDRALAMFEAVRAQAERHPERIAIATTADDVRRLAAEGRTAMLFGVEGGHAIEDDLPTLRRYFDLGARYMTLTWSFSHSWAGSSGDDGGGLTDFGREVVREMNRLGMLADVSHVSDATFWDVLETTRAPVIASHSSARALAPHPRNLDDAMLRAVAANGGVVMINFGGAFLDPRKTPYARWAWSWLRHGGDLPTTLSMLADHVEHVARVAGADHVGLGSDFDGTVSLPVALDSTHELPNLTVELVRRGWSDEDVRKLLGGNALRVLAEAEALAAP